MQGKAMKFKNILLLASSISLAACQTTSFPEYTYIGKNLQPETVKFLITQEFSERSSTGKTEFTFIQDGAYFELKETIDPGFVSLSQNQDKRLYSLLCAPNDNKVVNFIRDNGVGIKLVMIGGRADKEVGPWNADVCE